MGFLSYIPELRDIGLSGLWSFKVIKRLGQSTPGSSSLAISAVGSVRASEEQGLHKGYPESPIKEYSLNHKMKPLMI